MVCSVFIVTVYAYVEECESSLFITVTPRKR